MISARGSELEDQDGLDEARDPSRRAAEFAEEAPGLEGGDGLLDQCTDLRVGPVDGLLAGGEAVPSAAVRETNCAACALVALVRPAGEACLGESVDVLPCGSLSSSDR